ncbi:uncharacterized protein cd8b [Hypomesus transpacificus]|uniref:uncharacterized protein cd8b n=1 Tax=Hypomesus transpacificus TaxID=137520 RepID=UPI001F07DAB0|nr:uncharacterized protein cd8b [Hypomesus transpacificus]
MTPLVLAWAAMCLWTTVSSQPPEMTLQVLYPKIFDNETLTCSCSDGCIDVFWFRSVRSKNGSVIFQSLVYANKVERVKYRSDMAPKDQDRYKISVRDSGATVAFSLRIHCVTEMDAELYSCLFRKQNTHQELSTSGFLLRPGVSPPTLPPVTKPPRKIIPICRCTTRRSNHPKGCGTMVLWPLVGILLGLAVALISTLYYFSRLPRKCRHQFAKKR